jgi:hypothetical protein
MAMLARAVGSNLGRVWPGRLCLRAVHRVWALHRHLENSKLLAESQILSGQSYTREKERTETRDQAGDDGHHGS